MLYSLQLLVNTNPTSSINQNQPSPQHQDKIYQHETKSPSTLEKINKNKPIDPHTTEWANVNLAKFMGLMTVASTVENAIFYPFYVLKTREQSDRRNLTFLKSFNHHLRTSLTTKQSLYRGFWTSNFVSLPSYALYMGVYTWTKDTLLNSSQSNTKSIYAPFLAGFLADAVTVLFYVPGDVVIQRLQIVNSSYTSVTHACKTIYKEEGYKGFFRGLGATFTTSAIASSIWWVVYENMKLLLYRPNIERYLIYSDNNDTGQVHRLPQLCAGFTAGTITSTVINPFDVVKTRLQTQDMLHKTSSKFIYKNVFHGLRKLWVEEGVHGLSRGLLPKLISRGPLSAMSALAYELVLYYSRTDF
ncbi:unnamed protein product [Didymodactylos carnosus]|uniref:Mitochondrial carrier protein n=1 Tax=Didymodactylos carnosus TaxID=1234261 RepID=A0A813Q8C0_9BILA|nr:unnamed protein product [Didymodactylos carnosus]CAF0967834.1 unnamed protein product [Didymodactylos carnosus]CAF3544564.1 unnamed protein product [Didymodactylos carnosus]CAF3739537.1 unnamed protein product [Didymodactylos carnosus]